MGSGVFRPPPRVVWWLVGLFRPHASVGEGDGDGAVCSEGDASSAAVVFAVVVIGGMGSILGSIITGFGLGLVEGLTKVFYPEASNTVIFVIMAIVLLIKPAGLFGTQK